jgi:hypothetical protein
VQPVYISDERGHLDNVSDSFNTTTAIDNDLTVNSDIKTINASNAVYSAHANNRSTQPLASDLSNRDASELKSGRVSPSGSGFKNDPSSDLARNSADVELSRVADSETPLSESNTDVLPSVDYMNRIDFNADVINDYTLKSRDFSHTPDVYRKPFSLDLMLIGEKTLGYNRIYPEVSQLNLDLTPRDNGFGAGVTFGYRIVKRISVHSGIETIFRRYNLNYNYTTSSFVQQPDGSYKEVIEVLTNSRSVSEAEVRLPFMATYSFDAKKWLFEPAAGFTIKFKNLDVSANGNDQIPAVLLSTIEVSNEHLVTAGWMMSCSVGYQLFENSLVFVTPFYQAESFGKNSRQYYSGRAVSGAGLKAGMRILFYQAR